MDETKGNLAKWKLYEHINNTLINNHKEEEELENTTTINIDYVHNV